jgi:hypothetical protein
LYTYKNCMTSYSQQQLPPKSSSLPYYLMARAVSNLSNNV